MPGHWGIRGGHAAIPTPNPPMDLSWSFTTSHRGSSRGDAHARLSAHEIPYEVVQVAAVVSSSVLDTQMRYHIWILGNIAHFRIASGQSEVATSGSASYRIRLEVLICSHSAYGYTDIAAGGLGSTATPSSPRPGLRVVKVNLARTGELAANSD